MHSKYIFAGVLVLATLVSGCILDKQDVPLAEPLDENIISSVDSEANTFVSEIDELPQISVDIEDDINIDELEISLE